mmetsp:Transcript_73361/g.174769  ORF Transcript_73361/g.174769 Transcript_73361/m.174769 type:complete len:113 (-) Transcript_73361:88-426(-)
MRLQPNSTATADKIAMSESHTPTMIFLSEDPSLLLNSEPRNNWLWPRENPIMPIAIRHPAKLVATKRALQLEMKPVSVKGSSKRKEILVNSIPDLLCRDDVGFVMFLIKSDF